MSLRHFLPSYPWARYSRKLSNRIETPRHLGMFSKEDAAARGMRLAIGREGVILEGHALCFYLLVDESDGVIADARFEAFGPTALIGAADVACELLIRKNYDQARRLSADLIDKQVRDKSEEQAFPNEVSVYLNLVLFAIEEACNICMDIPLNDGYVVTPVMSLEEGGGNGYPGWDELSQKQKIAVVEEVIANDVRPYIELDAGGIQIVSLVNNELTIAYQGSCTTCYSSIGSTLNAIQQILRNKVSPDLIVTPDLSTLSKELSESR